MKTFGWFLGVSFFIVVGYYFVVHSGQFQIGQVDESVNLKWGRPDYPTTKIVHHHRLDKKDPHADAEDDSGSCLIFCGDD